MIRFPVRSMLCLLPRALRRGAVVCLFAAVPATAVVLYWDPNGSADGTGGDGTWDIRSTGFRLDLATGALVNWPPAEVTTAQAVFAGDAGGRVAVKSATTIQLNRLTFALDGYSLVGANNGDNTAVQFVGEAPELSVRTGVTTAVSVRLTGTALRLAGSGTLALSRAGVLDPDARLALTIDEGTTLDVGTFAQQTGAITLRNGRIAGTATIISDSAHRLESGFISAVLTGNASVRKDTAGTVTLSGANTYTGKTTVSVGRLLLADTGRLGGNGITVEAGAVLGGSGSVTANADINLSGTLSPGIAGAGLFTTWKQTWNGGAAYEWEIRRAGGTAGVDWDLLRISADGLNVSATAYNPFTLRVIGLGGAGPAGRPDGLLAGQSYSWLVAEIAGPVNGLNGFNDFEIDTNGWTDAGIFSLRQQLAGGLTQIYLDYTAAVPEPATSALLLGLMVFGFIGYRRWHHKSVHSG